MRRQEKAVYRGSGFEVGCSLDDLGVPLSAGGV